MSEIECEEILMAVMASFDAEEPSVSAEQIGLHLDACAECRTQVEQLKNTDQIFKRQERREEDADLWPAIQKQIVGRRQSSFSWRPFALVGVLLVAYKLFEMLSDQALSFALKFLPLAIAIALFVFLKENPFKINSELMLEK
ncbi:MAG TPA: hypothetical protein VJU86_05730 [Pyrinomonadaceae bacterium]|nr:hypothetical protein [Pyrinomonadaceae bacterium]